MKSGILSCVVLMVAAWTPSPAPAQQTSSPSSSPRPQNLRFLTTLCEQVLCLQFAFLKNTM